MELLRDATGSYILMGSAADADSYEASRFSQGLLPYALLLGMRGASLQDDRRLDVQSWFQYAAQQVPHLATSIGGVQRPVTSAPKGWSEPQK